MKIAVKMIDESGNDVLTFVEAENTADAAKWAESIAEFNGGLANVLCVAVPEYWVFSTAIQTDSILLEERHTGAFARVDDNTKEEWSAAFEAPSKPYKWPLANYARVIAMKYVGGQYVKDITGGDQ
jgi:hypothetical protein